MAISNAERQKQYRNKHKAVKRNAQDAPQSTPTVTAMQSHPQIVTKRNETVTERNVTDRNVTPDVTPFAFTPEQVADAFANANVGAVSSPDKLVPGNKNIWQRPDGSQYIVDAVGKRHEWPKVMDTVNTTGKPRVITIEDAIKDGIRASAAHTTEQPTATLRATANV
jgi:hypothetical protein